MALHKWAESHHKITLPALVQPKLDGIRIMVKLSPAYLTQTRPRKNSKQELLQAYADAVVMVYSRKRKIMPGFTELKQAVLPLLESRYSKTRELVLDGEIYNPDIKFEELVGHARNTDAKTAGQLQFYIFDVFYLVLDTLGLDSGLVRPGPEQFRARNELLTELLKSNANPILVQVETRPVRTELEVVEALNRAIAAKNEGVVVRDEAGLYETSTNREIRSYKALKFKQFQDEEYPIVGILEGEGKEMGAIRYRLSVDRGDLTNTKKQFVVTPNLPLEKRREMFKQYSKKEEFQKIYGKPMTVRFQDLTENGIPRFPKIITVRDYE